jgi:hypothetical protein
MTIGETIKVDIKNIKFIKDNPKIIVKVKSDRHYSFDRTISLTVHIGYKVGRHLVTIFSCSFRAYPKCCGTIILHSYIFFNLKIDGKSPYIYSTTMRGEIEDLLESFPHLKILECCFYELKKVSSRIVLTNPLKNMPTKIFLKAGFQEVGRFTNTNSGNTLVELAKTISGNGWKIS